MDILKKLSLADYLTLTGLFISWLSILLLIKEQINWAIIFIMIAMAFDLLDGYVARKTKRSSIFGRELDTYGDIFLYVVFSSILFHFALSPSFIASVLVGFFLVMFGGLRLIRFNLEGIKSNNGRKYYRGITVMHMLFLTIICYFINQLSEHWTSYISTAILLTASPAMISNYKSYKIDNYKIFVLVIMSVIAVSLILEYAYY